MLAGFLAVFEAIAVAVQLEDVDVMGQPVEQRAPGCRLTTAAGGA